MIAQQEMDAARILPNQLGHILEQQVGHAPGARRIFGAAVADFLKNQVSLGVCVEAGDPTKSTKIQAIAMEVAGHNDVRNGVRAQLDQVPPPELQVTIDLGRNAVLFADPSCHGTGRHHQRCSRLSGD